MSFWDVEGQKVEAQASIEVEGGNNSDMPIPSGTNVKIVIGDAKWETTERDGTFINLKHQVLQPECYKGRVVFQKLHVRCHEFSSAANHANLTPEKLVQKRAKNLRMLATIDTNAGGKLLASPNMPDDAMLQKCLVGKMMGMELDVWEIDKDKEGRAIQNAVDYARGNWVRKVYPKDTFSNMSKEEQAEAVEKTQQQWNRMLEMAGGQRAPRESTGQGGGQQRQPAQQRPQQQQGRASDFDAFDDDIPF